MIHNELNRKGLVPDEESTESIVLDGFFSQNFQVTDSFYLGKVQSSSFGKLLHTLPMPAVLVDESLTIIFANIAWGNFMLRRRRLTGNKFSTLFSNPHDPGKTTMLINRVFSDRKPEVSEGILQLDKKRIWARMHLRSLRLGKKRYALVLIEDLTLEKKQLLTAKRHEDSLKKIRHQLQKRVEQRTSELLHINEQLKEEIAQRKQTQEELRQSQDKYRTLIEDSFDGIFVHVNGKIVFANSRLCEMLGYEKEELKNLDHWLLSCCEHQKTVQDLALAPIRGEKGASHYDLRLQRKNGSTLDVEMNVRAIEFDGQSGVQVCVRDITDRKQSEELMVQAERIKAIAEMAGGVAHNFNNLLQIVVSGAQVALNQLDAANRSGVRTNLNRILESCMFGSETVKRLQDFAKIRSANTIRGAKSFDLSATVEHAIKISEAWWRTNKEKEGIRIHVSHDLQPDCLVEGMENELFEMCLNLIKNAVEALPDGGEIAITTSVSGSSVHLRVKDSGIGISPENLGKIFQPFWSTKGFQGSGMGLASSFGIVRRHRGDIIATSEEGNGTSITVVLPVSAEIPKQRKQERKQDSGRILRILLVDDMEQTVTMLQEGLRAFGHEVLIALSGNEAITIFKKHALDVVVCDLGMPEMNGWQVAKSISTICTEQGKHKTPFVLLTGWGGQIKEEGKIMECEVDRVVEKPVILTKLMEIIREVVRDESVDGPQPTVETHFPSSPDSASVF